MRNGSVLRMGVRNEWGNNIIIFGLNDCSRWENAICISESDALLLNKGYIEDTWSIFDREVSLHDPRNLYYFLILWSILCFDKVEIKARGHELFWKSFYFWFWWSRIHTNMKSLDLDFKKKFLTRPNNQKLAQKFIFMCYCF